MTSVTSDNDLPPDEEPEQVPLSTEDDSKILGSAKLDSQMDSENCVDADLTSDPPKEKSEITPDNNIEENIKADTTAILGDDSGTLKEDKPAAELKFQEELPTELTMEETSNIPNEPVDDIATITKPTFQFDSNIPLETESIQQTDTEQVQEEISPPDMTKDKEEEEEEEEEAEEEEVLEDTLEAEPPESTNNDAEQDVETKDEVTAVKSSLEDAPEQSELDEGSNILKIAESETLEEGATPVGEGLKPTVANSKQEEEEEKMKFEYIKDEDGKLVLQVTGSKTKSKKSPSSGSSKQKKNTRPSSSSKDKINEKSKSMDRSLASPGSVPRDKAKTKEKSKSLDRSPASPSVVPRDRQQRMVSKGAKPFLSPQVKAPKPKMDLRHILQKHEKKKPQVQPPPPGPEVNFYGSMSAIPFLKVNKPGGKKTEKSELSTRSPRVASKSIDIDDTPDTSPRKEKVSEVQEEEEGVSETFRLPTKEEITVEAQYDEAQLQMWKSMSALDSALEPVARPGEFLPLMPAEPKPKKRSSPVRKKNAVRAFHRPEDYLNPNLKSPESKRFLVNVNQDFIEDNSILEFEPDD